MHRSLGIGMFWTWAIYRPESTARLWLKTGPFCFTTRAQPESVVCYPSVLLPFNISMAKPAAHGAPIRATFMSEQV